MADNNYKSDRLKWILVLIAFILTGVMFAGIICGWFEKKDDTNPTETAQGNVLDENGDNLADGEVHPMPVNMLFALPMATAADTSTSVTVKATVLPEDATNKKLDWAVKWKNESSSWATGKQVASYVTVTPTADGSATATVTNKAAFGEQIVITVTSRDNPDAKAECTVDYLQRIESATLKIGSLSVNLGGNTNVTVLVGKNTGGAGGTITLTKTLASVYTVAETYTEKVSFTGGQQETSYDYGSDYFAYRSSGSMGSSSCIAFDDIDSAVGKSIYFDRRLFSAYNFYSASNRAASGDWTMYETKFSDMTAADINGYYEMRGSGKILWDITVTFTGSKKTYTYESALRWTGIDTTVSVSSVGVDTPSLAF